MKILIISHYFPPANSVASMRPYSWAKHWSRMGHQVTVLTSRKLPKSTDLRLDLSDFTIIEHKGRGWFDSKVDAVKSQSKSVGLGNQSTPQRIINKLISYWIKRFSALGVLTSDARMPNLHDLWVSDAFNKVHQMKWDVVVSTFAPYANHLVALQLRKTQHFFWIADYRDLWVKNHLRTGLPGFCLIEKWLKWRINNKADLITTVSAGLAEELSREVPNAKVAVIQNGFDPEDFEPVLPIVDSADGPIRIVYTGTIYPNFSNYTPLLKAIQEISKEGVACKRPLEFHFVGDAGDIDTLAQKYGVRDWIKLGGMVSREKALELQNSADVLLFLGTDSVEAKGMLTGKLFEYLASRRPIWAVGIAEDSEAARLIVSSGCGTVFHNNVAAIKAALLKLMQTDYARMPNTPGLPEQYSRKYLAEKMLSLVDLHESL